MNIKPYPYFRPLEKEDKPYFDEAFRINPPEISEFTFTNLYAWRGAYQFRVSILDYFILLRSEADKLPGFFYPIGRGDIKAAIERILIDSGGSFIRLPEEVKLLFDNNRQFRIEYDEDNADYLYKTDDLVSLPGGKYDGKRNLIKKFKSTYEYEYLKLAASNARACLDFEGKWCVVKDCDKIKGLSAERLAIREMIENFSFFNLSGGAIKIKGDIGAVAIGEKLNPGTLVIHVLKAEPGLAGLYQTMLNEFLAREGRGFEYVNLEQDLGIEGLRKSKLSYQPVKMVKKYTIWLNR